MSSPPSRTGARRTLGSLGTIAGWHALVALGFVVWVLTWPESMTTGGTWGLTLSRWLFALLLALLVVPALALSFGIACGLSFLPVLRRRPGLLAGTVAAAGGMAVVVAGITVYALISRAGWI